MALDAANSMALPKPHLLPEWATMGPRTPCAAVERGLLAGLITGVHS